jgi:ketosteroid isomerase-like protein
MNETEARLRAVATQFFEAWSTHEPERVLACYTEDVEYRDPNVGSPIRGAEALDRYLRQLFAGWRMKWELRESYPVLAGEGAAVMWRASFRRADGERTVDVEGIDLVVLRGNRIRKNYVYFDRAVLAPLGPL